MSDKGEAMTIDEFAKYQNDLQEIRRVGIGGMLPQLGERGDEIRRDWVTARDAYRKAIRDMYQLEWEFNALYGVEVPTGGPWSGRG